MCCDWGVTLQVSSGPHGLGSVSLLFYWKQAFGSCLRFLWELLWRLVVEPEVGRWIIYWAFREGVPNCVALAKLITCQAGLDKVTFFDWSSQKSPNQPRHRSGSSDVKVGSQPGVVLFLCKVIGSEQSGWAFKWSGWVFLLGQDEGWRWATWPGDSYGVIVDRVSGRNPGGLERGI